MPNGFNDQTVSTLVYSEYRVALLVALLISSTRALLRTGARPHPGPAHGGGGAAGGRGMEEQRAGEIGAWGRIS